MPSDPNETRLADLLLRWEELREQGQPRSAEELCADCPELAAELCRRIEALRSMESLLGSGCAGRPAGPKRPGGAGVP